MQHLGQCCVREALEQRNAACLRCSSQHSAVNWAGSREKTQACNCHQDGRPLSACADLPNRQLPASLQIVAANQIMTTGYCDPSPCFATFTDQFQSIAYYGCTRGDGDINNALNKKNVGCCLPAEMGGCATADASYGAKVNQCYSICARQCRQIKAAAGENKAQFEYSARKWLTSAQTVLGCHHLWSRATKPQRCCCAGSSVAAHRYSQTVCRA
jgi:hypothetical protein